jgi:hypothetical protein
MIDLRLPNFDDAFNRGFSLSALVTSRDGLGPIVAHLDENLARFVRSWRSSSIEEVVRVWRRMEVQMPKAKLAQSLQNPRELRYAVPGILRFGNLKRR